MESMSNTGLWVHGGLALFPLMSILGATFSSSICVILYLARKRVYSTHTSRIETDAIIKMLPKTSKWAQSEVYVPSCGWLPTWVFTPHYIANIKVSIHTEDRAQGYEVVIWRSCFQQWEQFDGMLRASTTASDSLESEVEGNNQLAVFLPHLVRGSASLNWPCYNVMSKYAHRPGTPESDLHQADQIARSALSRLNVIGSGVFMVCGPPATGKTSAGVRAAQILGANTVVCTCLDPSRAGNLISEAVKARDEHDPSAALVLIINEFDIVLDRLGCIPCHPTLVTEVTDKGSWNDWLDDVYRWKNVVIWLTSNADARKIASYDPSLTRAIRVTVQFRITRSDAFHIVDDSHPGTHHSRACDAPSRGSSCGGGSECGASSA